MPFSFEIFITGVRKVPWKNSNRCNKNFAPIPDTKGTRVPASVRERYMKKSPARILIALIAAAVVYTCALAAGLSGFSFDTSDGISNRLITPNGDGLNDAVVFTFNNPGDVQVTGKVFGLKGAEVALMTSGPSLAAPRATLKWDGMSGGRPVASGLYIYRIQAEKQVYSGLLAVIK